MIGSWDRHRWTQLAAGLSVILNVFLIGFLSAQALLDHTPAPETPPREILRQLGEKLPSADAEHLRRAFATRLPELARARRAARTASDTVHVEISAMPFDANRLRADLDASRAARETLRRLVEQALLEALPQMSDEGRQILSHYRLVRRQAFP